MDVSGPDARIKASPLPVTEDLRRHDGRAGMPPYRKPGQNLEEGQAGQARRPGKQWGYARFSPGARH